nr:reverse transcriptase domain-containing protein [Tanacetum cinerariifolium]
MEEMLYKFIDEGRREHEEMEPFIMVENSEISSLAPFLGYGGSGEGYGSLPMGFWGLLQVKKGEEHVTELGGKGKDDPTGCEEIPLDTLTLEQMLNNVRLEVEEVSEMSLELLRMAPKRTSTSATPAMNQAAIRQLIDDRLEGAVGLICWFERTELVFFRSNCTEDCKVKFATADFVVVDFEPDPRVLLILGRCFLKTDRALIDVHNGKLTLRIGNEAITYNLDQTSRYSANYDQMTANKIDITDEACEEYFQKVLGFSNVIASGSPTPSDDPIVSTNSPTLTPFGDSDFLLFEEANTFLGLEDDPDSLELDPSYYDPEGDIQMLEAILNSDNKLPVIITKELGEEEKAALIKVLKSHKQAIAWKLSDIQGINPEFCIHKILMEEDYKPTVQHQRRVNPKIHDVIKKEVEKLLDAGLIYPISDSPWVSPVHCVPKKGGFTVVKNEENELIPTRLVTGWWVCIDYQKLNEATRKDHFPFSFMDQMLERLAGNEYYCFLDCFSGYFQIPIDPRDQKKQRLHVLMECSPTVACLSICVMRREHFKDAC